MIVGLLAMETAYNQLLVVGFLVLTLDIVDLPLPNSLTTSVNMLQWRLKTELHRPTSRMHYWKTYYHETINYREYCLSHYRDRKKALLLSTI